MNAHRSEGASLRAARVLRVCSAAVMIMVSCHIAHGNAKPGKAARVGQRNLRNEVGDSRVAARLLPEPLSDVLEREAEQRTRGAAVPRRARRVTRLRTWARLVTRRT